MAITAIQYPSPTKMNSAHGRLDFAMDSDNKTHPNFKYVFEMWIDGSKVSTTKVYADPATGLGYYNASRVIRAYLSQKYFVDNVGFITNVNRDGFFSKDFTLKVGEEYGTPVTTYTSQWTSPNITAFNFYDDLPAIDLLIATGIQLTNRPLSQKVSMNDIGWFSQAVLTGFGSTPVELKVYDSTGALTGSRTATVGADIFQVGFTPVCINATYPGLITSTTAYYTIAIFGDAPITYTFYVDCFSRFDSYALTFLNMQGGYETVFMRGKSTRSKDIERKNFGTNEVRLAGTGATRFEEFTNRVYTGKQSTYSVQHKQKYKLSSEFLDDAGFAWLGELVCSPVIYLRLDRAGSSYYYPVQITQTNYDFKTRKVHGLNALELDVEILTTTNSQFA